MFATMQAFFVSTKNFDLTEKVSRIQAAIFV
jgi:hypothetical protein